MQDAARQQELMLKKLFECDRNGKIVEEGYGYE